MDGTLLAFSNESTETILMDWKNGAASLLSSEDDQQGFCVRRPRLEYISGGIADPIICITVQSLPASLPYTLISLHRCGSCTDPRDLF